MPSDRPDAVVFSRAAPSPAAVRSARATRSGRTFRLRAGESLEARRLLAAVPVGDLRVTVRINGASIPDVVQQYSAGSIGAKAWNTVNANGQAATFFYVETHQFAVKDLGASIAVTVAENNAFKNGIDGRFYTGFAALWQGKNLKLDKDPAGAKFIPWGKEFSTQPVTANAPVQLTIIPFNGTVYMPSKAYAIWLSPRTSNPLSKTVSADVGWQTASGNVETLGLVKPHWQYNASASTLTYVGSLSSYNLGGKLYGQPVALTLNDNVTLDLPLTNSSAVIQLPKVLNATQKSALTKLDKASDLRGLTPGHISALRAITIDTNVPIIKKEQLNSSVHVNGLGRINGFSVYKVPEFLQSKEFPDMHRFKNLGRPATLFDQIVTGQYMIRSALVEIQATKEIRVEGISVSYGPVRHQETIQLKSDQPTTLFDVKTPGTFRDASDGPVVLSPGATLSYLYLQHADDSIKVYNDNQNFNHITLIQGNAGAAVDLGAYGFNQPITKASVTDVYIHRIAQGDPGYDGLNAVITTRHGAPDVIKPHDISNVRISGVHIVNLGAKGPNVYFRKTAIGFVPGGYFAPGQHKLTTISNLTIEKFITELSPRDTAKKIISNENWYYLRDQGHLVYNLGDDKKQWYALLPSELPTPKPGEKPTKFALPAKPEGKQWGAFKNIDLGEVTYT